MTNVITMVWRACSTCSGLCLPTLRQMWRWNSHSQQWKLGIFRDARKLKAWLQGSKYLALRPSWTCQKIVGNLGVPELAWNKVQAAKVSKRWPRIQKKIIAIVRENFKCQWRHCPFLLMGESVATPLWGKCEDEIHTPKSGNLKSSRTLKNSELDCKGQNTSYWGVIYTIGKALKCRYPK
jgi:hypothetical protein